MSSSEWGDGALSGVTVPMVVAGVVVAMALAAVVGGAFVFGVGPFGAGTAPGAGPGSGDGGDGGGSNDPDHVRPFSFTIGAIESCGTTCRDVTASLTNNGGNAREGVVVTTEIYAGSDRVWKGRQELGTFASDETKTRTRRVDVGYVGAGKIEANDGYVTIVTTVKWDGGSATYRERRKVA